MELFSSLFPFPLPDASNAVRARAIRYLPPATLTTTADDSQIGVNLDRRHSPHLLTLLKSSGVNWTLTRSHSWSMNVELGVNSCQLNVDSESIHGQLNMTRSQFMVNWIQLSDLDFQVNSRRLQVSWAVNVRSLPSTSSQFRQHPVNSRHIRSTRAVNSTEECEATEREGEGRLTLWWHEEGRKSWWSTILAFHEGEIITVSWSIDLSYDCFK